MDLKRWFEKSRQGFAMGVFGAGNAGAAVTKFLAPSLVLAFGWEAVPRVYALALLVTAVLFWLVTWSDPAHRVPAAVTLREQLAVLKDVRVWRYSQYYSLVFGGYVGLSLIGGLGGFLLPIGVYMTSLGYSRDQPRPEADVARPLGVVPKLAICRFSSRPLAG